RYRDAGRHEDEHPGHAQAAWRLPALSTVRRWLAAIVLAVSAAGPAAAIDLPARKPGLWEITMTFEQRQRVPQVMHQCVDAGTDGLLQERFSLGQPSCPIHVSRLGSTIVVDWFCWTGRVMAAHVVFEGDFDSAYTATVMTPDGPPSAAGPHTYTTTVTQQAKW